MSRGLINRLTKERDEARARVAELETKIRTVLKLRDELGQDWTKNDRARRLPQSLGPSDR